MKKYFCFILCLNALVTQLQAQQLYQKNTNELYSRFRIAATGGWAYRLADISSRVPQAYAKDLKLGIHYDIDGSYYFSKIFGLALKYHEFFSKCTMQQSAVIKDNIKLIGPLFAVRFVKRNQIHLTLGMGYMEYKSKFYFSSGNLALMGSTIGFYSSASYDISLSKNLAAGFQIAIVSGVLNKMNVSNGNNAISQTASDDYENLTHLNLSVGIRFNN